MIDTPNFFAILPSAVRYNPKLTSRSVILYALLTSLAVADGEAYASNKYIADVLDVSEPTVKRLLRELEAERYIAMRYEYKDGTKEIAKRLIRIVDLPVLLDVAKTQALYAVIPTHVLSMRELSVQAKLLYAEISAATPTDGFCSKPATFFAKLLQTSESTVQRCTRELIQADALRVEMEYKGESRAIRNRRIYLTAAADIAEKRTKLAADGSEAVVSDKQPSEPAVSNTPDCGHILGGVKNDTTHAKPSTAPINAVKHPNRRRIRRGKRKKIMLKKRE